MMKKIILMLLSVLVIGLFLVGCGTGKATGETVSESNVEVLQSKIALYETCDIVITLKSNCLGIDCDWPSWFNPGNNPPREGYSGFFSEINNHKFDLNVSNMLPNGGKAYFDYGFNPWNVGRELVMLNKGGIHQFSDGMKLTLFDVWFDSENYANVRVCLDYEPKRVVERAVAEETPDLRIVSKSRG